MSGTVPGVLVAGGMPVVGADGRARVSGCCGCGTDPVPPGSVTLYFRSCCQQIFCNGQPVDLPVYRFVLQEGDPLITEIVRRDVERQRRMFFKYGDLCMRYARVEDGLLTPANSVLGDRSALVYFPNLLVNGDGTCPPGVCSCTDLVVLGTRCAGGSDILSTGKRAASCPARFCQVGTTFDQMPGDLSPRSYCFSFNSGAPLVQYNQTLHQLIGGFYGDCCECECNVADSLAGLNNSNVSTWQPTSKCCCGQRLNEFGSLEPSTICTGCVTQYSSTFLSESTTLVQGACGPVGSVVTLTLRNTYADGRPDEVYEQNVPIDCTDVRSAYQGTVLTPTFSYTGSCGAMTFSGTGPQGSSVTITITYTCGGGAPCANRCFASRQWPIAPNDPGGLL